MPDVRYAFTLSKCDAEQLHMEIAAALPTLVGVCGSISTIEALFPQPLTAAKRRKLQAIIEAHRPSSALSKTMPQSPSHVIAALVIKQSPMIWDKLSADHKNELQSVIDQESMRIYGAIMDATKSAKLIKNNHLRSSHP